jgi:hypothetical protein
MTAWATGGLPGERTPERPHGHHLHRSSFKALGHGTDKLPVKADLRRAIGKQAGDTVTMNLEERLES